MRKFYLLSSSLFLFNLGAIAQSLTSSNSPQIGDTYNVITLSNTNLTTASVGSGGTGQTWDFSSFAKGSSTTETYVDPSTTPYATSYPSANLAINASGSYAYLQTNSGSVVELGAVTSTTYQGSPVTSTQTSNEIVYDYPLNYNTQQVHTFSGTTTENITGEGTITIYRTGNDTILLDGAGSLITPDGNIVTNVLREKTIQNFKDSADYSSLYSLPAGSFYSVTLTRTESYGYVISGTRSSLIAVSFTTTNTYEYTLGSGSWSGPSTINSAQYYTQGTPTGIANANTTSTNISVYPNPVTDNLNVNFGNTSCCSLELTDIIGNEVLSSANGTISISGQTATMNVSGLSKGIYILQLNGGGSIQTQKIVVD